MNRIATIILGFALLFTVSAIAEDARSEVSLEGTGFFTQNSNNAGISQRATNAGEFLVGYRYHLNDWFAAEANYGYSRDTRPTLTAAVSHAFRRTSMRRLRRLWSHRQSTG